jgi:Mn2+/Fe2+ NRAMP family transporter
MVTFQITIANSISQLRRQKLFIFHPENPQVLNRLLHTLRLMGPGILFAGAAIGVSHLVQSTRAGASFGWELAWVVVAVNLFKYPFFEFGSRYALATGESLLQGYRRQGKWVLWFFLVVTVLTVFTVQATVTLVTAGIAQNLLPIGESPIWWSAIILSVCAGLLIIGKYSLLDKTMKGIVVLLSLSTVIALAGAWLKYDSSLVIETPHFDWSNTSHLVFLIAFMGWMPAPIDLSVWYSIWSLEKRKQQPEFNAQNSLFDFKIGYWSTAVLALAFVGLGAVSIYGTGQELPDGAASFSNALINIYANTLGPVARWGIAIAALTTMFSTALTCFDAIPRTLSQTTLILTNHDTPKKEQQYYWLVMAILFAGALALISFFSTSMLQLVQLATILSFLTAPFFAFANYHLVTSKHTPLEAQPQLPLRVLSWLGIAFLLVFCGVYGCTLLLPS